MSTPGSQTTPPDDERAQEFTDSVLIDRPRHELFAFWRNFNNLPKFMEKVQKVTEVDSISSIWTVAMSSGESTDWEFIVTDEEEDRLIAWSASGRTPVKYAGRVEFKDVAPGSVPGESIETPRPPFTEVTATLRYQPQSGILDTLIATVSGADRSPELPVQTRSDLLRFKEVMERGGAT